MSSLPVQASLLATVIETLLKAKAPRRTVAAAAAAIVATVCRSEPAPATLVTAGQGHVPAGRSERCRPRILASRAVQETSSCKGS